MSKSSIKNSRYRNAQMIKVELAYLVIYGQIKTKVYQTAHSCETFSIQSYLIYEVKQ